MQHTHKQQYGKNYWNRVISLKDNWSLLDKILQNKLENKDKINIYLYKYNLLKITTEEPKDLRTHLPENREYQQIITHTKAHSSDVATTIWILNFDILPD